MSLKSYRGWGIKAEYMLEGKTHENREGHAQRLRLSMFAVLAKSIFIGGLTMGWG